MALVFAIMHKIIYIYKSFLSVLFSLFFFCPFNLVLIMILSGKLYQHVLLQPYNLHAFLNERNSKGPTFEKIVFNVCVCVSRYVLFHICVGINFVDLT